MKKHIELRLMGLGFLGLMLLFLWLFITFINPISKTLAGISAFCWLLAFLILQYPIYKSEIKRGKQ